MFFAVSSLITAQSGREAEREEGQAENRLRERSPAAGEPGRNGQEAGGGVRPSPPCYHMQRERRAEPNNLAGRMEAASSCYECVFFISGREFRTL